MQLEKLYSFGTRMLLIAFLLLFDILAGCTGGPAANLSQPSEPPQFVVPVSRHETGGFVEVKPTDDELGERTWC